MNRNLPKDRNEIFVEINPGKILKILGFETEYKLADRQDLEIFDIGDDLQINNLDKELTFRKSGVDVKIFGIPNEPVPLTNDTINKYGLSSRLVYICD